MKEPLKKPLKWSTFLLPSDVDPDPEDKKSPNICQNLAEKLNLKSFIYIWDFFFQLNTLKSHKI